MCLRIVYGCTPTESLFGDCTASVAGYGGTEVGCFGSKRRGGDRNFRQCHTGGSDGDSIAVSGSFSVGCISPDMINGAFFEFIDFSCEYITFC